MLLICLYILIATACASDREPGRRKNVYVNRILNTGTSQWL